MRRQDKYPDTESFHYFNANPKGKLTTDCVIRALSVAMEMNYIDVLNGLTRMAIKTGYHISDAKCYGKFLEANGFHRNPQPKHKDGTKYTGKDFWDFFPTSRPRQVVANIGSHHVVAIMDGKVWDTWDSSNGRIGNYWTKI